MDPRQKPEDTMASHLEKTAQAEAGPELSSLPLKGEDIAEEYSPEEMRRLLRKVDMRVIPILAILYFLSFLDRGELSPVRIVNFQPEDRRLTMYRKHRKCEHPRVIGRLEFGGKPVQLVRISQVIQGSFS